MEEKKEQVESKEVYTKSIGEKMNNLIERIQKVFEQKYNFKPSIKDTTNMIADAVNKAGLKLV